MDDICIICGCSVLAPGGDFWANVYDGDVVCLDETCEKAYAKISKLNALLKEAIIVINGIDGEYFLGDYNRAVNLRNELNKEFGNE